MHLTQILSTQNGTRSWRWKDAIFAFGGGSLSVCALFVALRLAWAEIGAPPLTKGVYGLTSGRLTDVPLEILEHPDVVGVSLRIDWNDVEPSEGSYDWSMIDHKVSQAADAGKAVLLQVTPGEDSPEWIYSAGAAAFAYIDANPYRHTFCQEIHLPVPWDEVYLAKWTNFITALGQRYGSDQRIKIVRASGGSNANSAEMNLPDDDAKTVTRTNSDGSVTSCMTYDDIANWNAIGYTPEKINNAWKTILDAYATAFPNVWLNVPVGRIKINDEANKGMTVANGVAAYGDTALEQRFMISFNSLSAVTPEPPPPARDVRELLVWNHRPQIMLQFLWFTTGDSTCRNNKRNCDYNNDGIKEATDQYLIFQDAIQTGILYQPQVIEVYLSDIANSAFQPIFTSAAEQLNASPTTTTTTTTTLPAVMCKGVLATIVGTPGNDVIFGTSGDDVIAGLGGNDKIKGLGGDDMICGGDGRDRLYGGGGNDLLLGEGDNDRIKGGNGEDMLFGGDGNDYLKGGLGDDALDGGAENDFCNGERGTDTSADCETIKRIP